MKHQNKKTLRKGQLSHGKLMRRDGRPAALRRNPPVWHDIIPLWKTTRLGKKDGGGFMVGGRAEWHIGEILITKPQAKSHGSIPGAAIIFL